MLPIRLIILLPAIACSCSNNDAPKPVDCTLSGLSVIVENIVPATDCSATDGVITVHATGGEPPYMYRLNNGDNQQEGNFDGIQAGVYSVKVIDHHECEVYAENIVVPAEGLSFNTTIQDDDGCLNDNGSVTIDILEGTGPFQYQYNDGNFTGNNFFADLPAGDHLFSVRTADGCTVRLNVTIPRAATGVSWAQEILPVIETKCALFGCHNGDARPDLRNYNNALFYASSIKKFTRDRSMPFDGSLTQAQIDLIACWVDDGAMNN